LTDSQIHQHMNDIVKITSQITEDVRKTWNGLWTFNYRPTLRRRRL